MTLTTLLFVAGAIFGSFSMAIYHLIRMRQVARQDKGKVSSLDQLPFGEWRVIAREDARRENDFLEEHFYILQKIHPAGWPTCQYKAVKMYGRIEGSTLRKVKSRYRYHRDYPDYEIECFDEEEEDEIMSLLESDSELDVWIADDFDDFTN